MSIRRKTINLTLTNNVLSATDSVTGLVTTDAGVQGEDGAVWLHIAIPTDWQDLSCRLRVISSDGDYDESSLPVANIIEMPIKQALTSPGRLIVRLVGTTTTGIRKSIDLKSLTIQSSMQETELINSVYPYPIHHITGSGGALVIQTDNDTYNINVTGTGGDMLQANYANGTGSANTNKVDHAMSADTASTALAGSTLANQLNTGWTPAGETWTYASTNTITVPTGAALRYQKGDRIKWTQTTIKYGVIVAVADTLLTIAVNTDFVVANATISANYYSHELNPMGYPTCFSWTPVITADTGTPTVVTPSIKYAICGNEIRLMGKLVINNKGTAAGGIVFTTPVQAIITSIGSVQEVAASGISGVVNVGTSTINANIVSYSYTPTFWVTGYTVGFSISYFF